MTNINKTPIKKTNVFIKIIHQQWFAILIGVVLISAIIGIIQPVFFSYLNFKNILLQSSVAAIIAVGMTFVICTGGIDISVAMNLFLVMGSMYALNKAGMPNYLVFVLAVLIGIIVGITNGILVSFFSIPAMIATFATLSICRGLAYIVINNKQVTPDVSLRFFGTTMIGPIPLAVIIMVFIAIIGDYMLRNTRFGRYVQAVGDNPISARESKIPVRLVIFSTYIFCGFCTGIAALIYLGRLGSIQTDSGYGMEFTVITAVVLGGTRLSGGRGAIIGSILGCMFLTLIENALSLLGVSGFYYDVFRGSILFVSVAIEALSSYRQKQQNINRKSLELKR